MDDRPTCRNDQCTEAAEEHPGNQKHERRRIGAFQSQVSKCFLSVAVCHIDRSFPGKLYFGKEVCSKPSGKLVQMEEKLCKY
jgi:hypothetical protein